MLRMNIQCLAGIELIKFFSSPIIFAYLFQVQTMATSRQDVLDNKVIHADLSALHIDIDFATSIANAILKNHSLQSIDFFMSDFDDEVFLIIKNALVQRNRRIVELNLDVTNITAKSMSTLLDLLNTNLVLRLYLFKTKGIYDNAENMKILTVCAKGKKIIKVRIL